MRMDMLGVGARCRCGDAYESSISATRVVEKRTYQGAPNVRDEEGTRGEQRVTRWNNDQHAINQFQACVRLVNSSKRFPTTVLLASMCETSPTKKLFSRFPVPLRACPTSHPKLCTHAPRRQPCASSCKSLFDTH